MLLCALARSLALTLALASFNAFAAEAPATPAAKSSLCERYLLAKPYVTAEKAADLCGTYPQGALGCAMDEVDRGEAPAFADALEYCINPLDTGAGN